MRKPSDACWTSWPPRCASLSRCAAHPDKTHGKKKTSLRELQDRTGGFSAFIPLAFHSENTGLPHIPRTTAFDDLSNIIAARLVLDNFDHIKAYWVMIGEKLAQLALSFGADDLDGTIIEEKITHMAGAKSAKGLTREEMIHMIEAASFEPIERDSFYNQVKA